MISMAQKRPFDNSSVVQCKDDLEEHVSGKEITI